MRVVHICNLPLPENHPEYGRISCHPGRWVLNLALAQKRHTDIDPILVVQVPGSTRNYLAQIEGIDVHYLAAPDTLRSATLFQFDARRMGSYALKLKPDLVHAHGTEDAYALAAQFTGLPYLVTAQGCYFIINRHLKPRLISRAKAVEFCEWLALRKTTHVIAKSDYVARLLQERFPHLQIHRIPNTFDPRLLEIDPVQPREPHSVAFVGTIDHRKGFHLIREALESSTELQSTISLHVFGNKSASASPYEHSELEKMRTLLRDRLVLHGIRPALEVAEALARCRLLVAPSLEEMFGNQVIEALLVGTPAIVTEGTAMAENIRKFGHGSVVAQKDTAELASAIERYFWDFDPAVSAVTRSRMIQALGPEAVAKKHLELCRSILNKAPLTPDRNHA
ncbi:MAG: glycosyltransferase family 4 protein [Methylacidiphilales bacterium]|nr:glycosyltransferase family 4 protein [Candidatus Methylacidiphilales bacterium]